MTSPFDLFLFSTDPLFVQQAVAAGVAGVVIDWEQSGKADRQRHADTEINAQTADDLRAVREATPARILCRINPHGATTEREIEDAIAAGADEILLPMVRAAEEVRAALTFAGGRCGVGMLVETVDAVQRLDALCQLPLSRVYVGLNDLAIDRREPCIFSPLLDGTLERIRSKVKVPFGFAGLTLVREGFPVPCRLLIGEMARLECSFTFLRRSFHRDVTGQPLTRAVPEILDALASARRRRSDVVERDRLELHAAVGAAVQATGAPLSVS